MTPSLKMWDGKFYVKNCILSLISCDFRMTYCAQLINGSLLETLLVQFNQLAMFKDRKPVLPFWVSQKHAWKSDSCPQVLNVWSTFHQLMDSLFGVKCVTCPLHLFAFCVWSIFCLLSLVIIYPSNFMLEIVLVISSQSLDFDQEHIFITGSLLMHCLISELMSHEKTKTNIDL